MKTNPILLQTGAFSNVLVSMSREDTGGVLGAIAHPSEHSSPYKKTRELYRSYFSSSGIMHFTVSSDLMFWKKKIGQIEHPFFQVLRQGQPSPVPSVPAAPLPFLVSERLLCTTLRVIALF